MEWKLDLHVHSDRSADGRMTLAEIIETAKSRGLSGVAICDHDAVMASVPSVPDFLIIPATEVSTKQGHLLGLFVTEPVTAKDLPEAAAAIHAQGGIAVLAHPFQHNPDENRLLPYLDSLDGIEVQNSRANRKNKNANAQAKDFALLHHLPHFAGSDAHVPQEIGGSVTIVAAQSPEAVKAALLSGAARTEGRSAKSRYVAMSQLTKRRKTNAGVLSYAKWSVFALKCCIEDLFRGNR